MKLSDILDIAAIKRAGVEIPIDVNLDGDETELYLDWTKIDDVRIYKAVRQFYKSAASTLNFIKIFSLDEKNYNTRLGLAKVDENGKLGTGHSNPLAVEQLKDDTYLQRIILSSTVSDTEFISKLFSCLMRYDRVGSDTTSDLVIKMALQTFIDYTRDVFRFMKTGITASLNVNGTINVYGINLLCIPLSYVSKTITSTTTYAAPKKYGVIIEHEKMMMISEMRARIQYAHIKGLINNKSGFRALTKFLNLAELYKFEEKTIKDALDALPKTPKMLDLYKLVDCKKYIEYVLQ